MKLGVLFLTGLLFSGFSAGQCTLPANPSAATVDSTFDAYTTQNGPG